MTEERMELPGSAGVTAGDEPRSGAIDPAAEIALAHVRQDRSPYGGKFSRRELRFEVRGVEQVEDGTRVHIAYRPAGRWAGRPGEEWVLVAPDGRIMSRDQVTRPRDAPPWALLALAGLSVIVAAVVVPWLLVFRGEAEGDPLYRAGSTLWMRTSRPTLVDEIQYAGQDVDGNPATYRIAGPGEGRKLAVITVTLFNEEAQQVSVTVDENAAEVTDQDGNDYKPLNVVERSVAMQGAVDPKYRFPDFVGLWRSFIIRSGESVSGMLIFEVPEDADLKRLTWRASDTIITRFR